MSSTMHLLNNGTNVTTVTTTSSNAFSISTTTKTGNDNLRSILSYALPLGCLAVVLVIGIVFAIRQRHRILDRWISLRQMRNTDPRFLQNTGLRRDSEFESSSHSSVQTTLRTLENPLHRERQYDLTTIS